jgi:large subunit ribosomal protein L1
MSKKPSKRYRAAQQVADLKAKYDVNQAAEIIKKMPGTKFDETVEISAFLGVDPKQSDQMVRGTVSLPNGSGKKIKVLAFTENAAEALAAGADYAGLADLIAKVNGGFLDFDVAISTVDEGRPSGRPRPRSEGAHAEPQVRHRFRRHPEDHQGSQGRPR